MSDFPVDDATLVMLAEACRINEELGRTTLHDFLHMGSRVRSAEDETGTVHATVDEAVEASEEAVPVIYVEHEPGFEPYSEHGVILALVAEIQRLRGSGQ